MMKLKFDDVRQLQITIHNLTSLALSPSPSRTGHAYEQHHVALTAVRCTQHFQLSVRCQAADPQVMTMQEMHFVAKDKGHDT